MARKETKKSHSKKYLIAAFVLVSSLLIMADVGKNLANEIRTTLELKTLSTESVKPQSKNNPTLSEEEMERWAKRLKTHSDA